MLKHILWIMALLVVVTMSAAAQFKSQVTSEGRVSDGVGLDASPSLILGWFDPERFHMHHTFSMSYMTGAGQSLSLGTYTNSMMYDFSDKLNARADVSMMYSPFNSLPSVGKGRNDLSSIFLSRAELSYRPWDNVLLQVQYRQYPFGTFSYSPYDSPWFGGNGF